MRRQAEAVQRARRSDAPGRPARCSTRCSARAPGHAQAERQDGDDRRLHGEGVHARRRSVPRQHLDDRRDRASRRRRASGASWRRARPRRPARRGRWRRRWRRCRAAAPHRHGGHDRATAAFTHRHRGARGEHEGRRRPTCSPCRRASPRPRRRRLRVVRARSASAARRAAPEPVATVVSSSPPRRRSAPKRSANTCRTAGTNDDPPVRNTVATSRRRDAAAQRAARRRRPRWRRPRRDPALEVARARTAAGEVDRRRRRSGSSPPRPADSARFGALDRAVQREAEVVLHEVHQRRDLLRLERLVAQPAEQLAGLARLEERQLLPALDPLVEPQRHGQHLAEGGAALRAEAEPGRRDVADQAGVERVAGERHAVDAEDRRCRRARAAPA